jgi:threonine synthase
MPYLQCERCGRKYDNTFRLKCQCGGVLNVIYDNFSFEPGEFMDVRRYLKMLPINEAYLPKIVLPITPIVKYNLYGIDVFFKMEYLMPSGSFKDRGTYITVSKLKEKGIKEIVLDSSGNAGISFSLFGKSEGMKVHVFIPSYTSQGKKRILRELGAIVHEINGSRMDTHREAERSNLGEYVSHWYNPYFIEGTKLIAYEAYEQIGEVDYVIAPVGSGGIFTGIYRGFRDLNIIPKMIAVQAKGYESLCDKTQEKSKLAEGIFIPEPPRREEMMKILEESGGFCVTVDDDEIGIALRELISLGFIVEPTSAVVLAALKKIMGRIKKNSKVLMPLTGSGLKML